MYFSSKGHNSLGGYDIFVSYVDDLGHWGKPVNLGYPVNTPYDDLFFSSTASGKYAFISSNRKDSLCKGNLDIYKPLTKDEIDSEFFDWLNNEVPEKFAFLHVGMWGKGGLGEDRKDLGMLVKVFLETFKNQKNQPALILKTSGATPCVIDREVGITINNWFCLQSI